MQFEELPTGDRATPGRAGLDPDTEPASPGLTDRPEGPQSAPLQIFEGRLHPLTLVFGLFKGARVLVPMIPLFFFGKGWGAALAFGIAAAGTIASQLIRYFTFRYRIERGELVIESGLLERQHRSIPLERVQEIRIEQGVVHRLLDVVDATVETGGGGGAEATLAVLSRGEYERLRRLVFERAAALRTNTPSPVAIPPIAALEDQIIRRLGLRDLVVAGLTSNHWLSAVALAGALWNFADDILPDDYYLRATKYLVRNAKLLADRDVEMAVIGALLGLLAMLLIGMVFSVAGTILLFHGFTLSRRGDDLRRRYGLLTRRASNLPRRRIQVLEIEEKLVRRWFGYATLRADTSGGKREGEDDNEGRDVLLPIARRAEVEQLTLSLLPDFAEEPWAWRRVSRLAIRRGVMKGALICLAAAVAAVSMQRNWVALWPLLFIPLVWWMNVRSYHHLGYALSDRYLQTRRGWLGRSTHIVPIHKIQAVELLQTPFDRRLGLARLRVDTAGQAYTGGGPQIANLPVEEARAIARTLAQQAAKSQYRW
jgi:putative membrane protein